MTNRHSTTIYVDLLGTQAKFSHHAECLHRKCFIEFVEINMLVLPSGLLPDLADCSHRRHHHPLGINATSGLSDDANHRLCTKLLCACSTGDDDRCRAVIHAWSIARSYCPVFLECGFKRTQQFSRSVLTRRFVLIEDHG